MLNVALGHSADIDLAACVEEVIAQVAPLLSAHPAAAGVLFVSDSLDPAPVLRRIKAAYPHMLLIGCASAAEASSREGFQEDSVLLIAMASEDASFAASIGRGVGGAPVAAARQLVEGLGPAAEPGACKLLVAFIDPIGTRPDLVLEGVAARLGEGPCIVGGGANPSLSADRPAPVVFFEAEAATDAVVALALCGAVRAETATVTSWRPIGKRGVITHAEGDRIFHIDGRPALEFYRRNLGADVQTFIGAPLAIVESEKSLNIRAAIDFDEQAGSVRVGGLIANGDVVQLSYAGFDEILEGAGALAQAVEDARADAPALVLYCSCVVRKMFLALDVGAELERLRAPFGEGAAVAGYYAYGEISATAGAAAPKFRNQAIVALTLS